LSTKKAPGVFFVQLKTASEILDEIKKIKQLETDSALGDLFGVKQPTVSAWRARNSIPYSIVFEFCLKESVSTDQIFFKHGSVRISGILKDRFGNEYTRSYEVDDLFPTRLKMELNGRSVEWLSEASNINKQTIENLLSSKKIPTVDELEAISDAFININPAWLAERSLSQTENWMFELRKINSTDLLSAELIKLYLVAAEQFIDKMQGLIALSTEQKADVVNTACRVHMKEAPESKEVNIELIKFLLRQADRMRGSSTL
jgi:hypothetical protein